MTRKITRPSTARCTLPMYIGFLLGEPQHGSCCRLAEVMDISHDSATRLLQRERYDGKDLYHESAPLLDLKGGTLNVDDSVLDKPYSQYLALVGYFWSGKHHRPVKGINLITLYYTDVHGHHLLVQLTLSPLELIGRIAARVPPPRQHRHRYYGVLAPNSPLRPAVTALAPAPVATEPVVAYGPKPPGFRRLAEPEPSPLSPLQT